MTLSSLHQLTRAAINDYMDKQVFRRAAQSYLRRLAKDLALVKGEFTIRFNAGGQACSGDATLHHERFYLTIGETGVMYRRCKGQKDYTGEANQWAIGFGNQLTDSQLREELARILVG